MLLANVVSLGEENKQARRTSKTPLSALGDSTWSSAFHVWRMDWTADSIALYVDDRRLNAVALDALANQDGSGFNPFRQPHYMLLNLAIGGQNGGDPTDTTFPGLFSVDYIRVYQQR